MQLQLGVFLKVSSSWKENLMLLYVFWNIQLMLGISFPWSRWELYAHRSQDKNIISCFFSLDDEATYITPSFAA